MHLDRRALGYAISIEAVSASFAAFGGPHRALGTWPWMLQLPGILLIFFVSGGAHLAWRIAGMLLIQCVVWYGIIAVGRHLRRVQPKNPRGTA